MLENELDLVVKFQNGDSAAFTGLYNHYIEKIYNFIYYKTCHKETAEDLTSVVFTKVLEKIQQYRAEKGSFSAWLYQVARNTVVDHYRTTHSTSDIEEVWDLSSNEDIVGAVDNSMIFSELKPYLEALPADKREIITLRIWQGLSYREIAEVMAKSEDNCKVIFSRAIKELKGKLPITLAVLLNLLLLGRGVWR